MSEKYVIIPEKDFMEWTLGSYALRQKAVRMSDDDVFLRCLLKKYASSALRQAQRDNSERAKPIIEWPREYLGEFIQTEKYDYFLAKEVYDELDKLDFKTSREYKEFAQKLCEHRGLKFGDLILYSKRKDK